MELLTFGLNHQTAPLAVRERVVFHAESLVQALRDLADVKRVKEAAIISTSTIAPPLMPGLAVPTRPSNLTFASSLLIVRLARGNGGIGPRQARVEQSRRMTWTKKRCF